MKMNGENLVDGSYKKRRSVGNDWRRSSPDTNNKKEIKDMDRTHTLSIDSLLRAVFGIKKILKAIKRKTTDHGLDDDIWI